MDAENLRRRADWDRERETLLGRRISDLHLSIRGSRVERLVTALNEELEKRGIAYHPTVYLSDQWGCPDRTPVIGVPFYLADPRLESIEREMAGTIEDDAESLRYLRHECGHAINYAFQLYQRPDWRAVFGRFSQPYHDRYDADPLSRAYVRHILGWYAQKHPDEDFAETFAVWLATDDWRARYRDWPALEKLEYVERIMREIADRHLEPEQPSEDDLPVEAMQYSVAEHYRLSEETLPIGDPRQFDVDLHRLFLGAAQAPSGESARGFLERHRGEVVSRITYWTGESPSLVRSLLNHLAARAGDLDLRVGTLEAATLIELTAFATTVVMHHRHAHTARPEERRRGGSAA